MTNTDERKKVLYLIGSLRNPQVPILAAHIRSIFPNIEVFDDWHAAGPEADDHWQQYEKSRGFNLSEALQSWAAQHVFQFDKYHLERADAACLVLPAGRSGHLELGFVAGLGKPTYVLLDKEPDRWDVMYGFCTRVFATRDELEEHLKNEFQG